MSGSNNKSCLQKLPSDKATFLAIIKGLFILILMVSTGTSISIYYKSSVPIEAILLSRECVIFLFGAAVGLLLVTSAMWGLIIKMWIDEKQSTRKEGKYIEDDEHTQASEEQEIAFDEDDVCEIV